MGADIKSLRTRIKSVDSTLHLTKAMGLVASSKIRRATEAMVKSRDYSDSLITLMNQLIGCPDCKNSPYMAKRDTGRTRIIVIAGDRGLAGGYNSNVFRFCKDYRDAEFIPIGKRACERFEKPYNSAEAFSSADAVDLAEKLCNDYANAEYDKLGIISTKYISIMSQEPQIHWIFPLERDEDSVVKSMVFEPDEETILNIAVKEYVVGRIVAAVRESFASEVAARRCAMDSAGKNAQQMIDDLQLEYNRARQGAITQELTEIVAGSGT